MARVAFLSIYTPTYKRPRLLDDCIASVQEQTAVKLVQHVIVRDEIGVGIAGMYRALKQNAGVLSGEYVYILQDDDRLAGAQAVELLKLFALANDNPPVIMVKNRKRGNVYPTFWREAPQLCHVDLGNFLVRRDVFRQHVDDFGEHYSGDFDFIDCLWKAGWGFAWCDLIFAEAQALGLGRTEAELVRMNEVRL